MRLILLLAVAACAAVPAFAQIIPKDAKEPVEVKKPRGEFAKKLHGVVFPSGKGWKAVMDPQRRYQIMLPDTWKVDTTGGADELSALPPNDKSAKLMVFIVVPRDADPLEIEDDFAAGYADALAQDPAFSRLKFQPTDSGLVIARGLRFALGGGTMVRSSETYQTQQLVYISEDRVLVVNFQSLQKDFPKYADQVARIFASYQTMGMRKLDVD
jgi:hypothetical protein